MLTGIVFLVGCQVSGNALSSRDMKSNPVGYFEIPANDLDRATRFYERVFGWELERTSIDGHPMALFPYDAAAPGVTGALASGESYVPSRHGPRVYFRTTDIDAVLTRAVQAGGQVLYPKKSIGDLGWVAEFEDSEGNAIALHAD